MAVFRSKTMRVSFDGIDRLRYQAIRARIRAQAFEVRCTGDAGSATSNGVEIAWEYIEADSRLVFNCVKRPWWVQESLVARRIRDLMEAM
jgi:hypothetical protein